MLLSIGIGLSTLESKLRQTGKFYRRSCRARTLSISARQASASSGISLAVKPEMRERRFDQWWITACWYAIARPLRRMCASSFASATIASQLRR